MKKKEFYERMQELLPEFHYFSLGTSLEEKQFVIHTGAFQKQSWFIPYGKIQFVTLRQAPLLRLFHLIKGNVNILASFGNNILSLPFIHQKEAAELQKKLLG